MIDRRQSLLFIIGTVACATVEPVAPASAALQPWEPYDKRFEGCAGG